MAGKREPLISEFAEIADEQARRRREKSPFRTFFLDFLPLAHLLGCTESVALAFSDQGVRVLFTGVDKNADWLKETLKRFAAQPLPENSLSEDGFFSSIICSALGMWGGEVVVGCASADSDSPVEAVSIKSHGYQWGQAGLLPGTFLMQFLPDLERVDLKALEEKVQLDFFHHCLEDRLLVTCGTTVHGLSGPAFTAAGSQAELSVGLWAVVHPQKEENRFQIGRSFSGGADSAVKRRELSYRTFRTGIVPEPSGEPPGSCRSVVYFDYDESPRRSSLIWTCYGVEVGHRHWTLRGHRLGVRVVTHVPELSGWSCGCPEFAVERLEQQSEALSEDFQKAFERMVLEYNAYSPSIERSTVGCWFMLVLTALALGGVAAPFMGSQLASGLSAVTALLLIGAEFRFRYARRYAVGKSFEKLAASWEKGKAKELWSSAVLAPNGEQITPGETP